MTTYPAPLADYDPAWIRSWARSRGIVVADRGRLSKALIDQYRIEQSLSDEEMARYGSEVDLDG